MSLPRAQPVYILRGHNSQIHTAAFIRGNARLLTADALGWVVLWDLAIKRPCAVWRAHESAILGACAWREENIITHGKDNKLIVWKISKEDEPSMSTILPVESISEPRKKPWVLHILEVNAMNFCSFAHTSLPSPDELLIAVPNTLNSETADLYHLPSTKRTHSVLRSPLFKGGIIMALRLFHHPSTGHLTLLAGFESGHTSITQLISMVWSTIHVTKSHSQPVLSLDTVPGGMSWFSSAADAVVARYLLPVMERDTKDVVTTADQILHTKHAGQQSLRVRNDGKIFATAGWDGRVRVYSCKSMKELAVLKWHREGCYAIAFAEVGEGEGTELVVGKSVQQERQRIARSTHFIAAGAKDGKVSLWDIY